MTYGRARLWLGITGVGSWVLISIAALLFGLPGSFLTNDATFGISDVWQLMAVTGLATLWLIPLDLLGGYWLPQKYGKSDQSFRSWFIGYVFAAVTQAMLFVVFGSAILLAGQWSGRIGGGLAVGLLTFACIAYRNRWVLNRQTDVLGSETKLSEAIALLRSWQVSVPRIIVVSHRDVGFTGGVIGFGSRTGVVIPKAWLSFSTDELASAIARRAMAIESGSYTRGLLLAFSWNLTGFILCSFLPGAGLSSVAGLVTTVCGFTLWSFAGLLTLPTISRNASLAIDDQLFKQGLSRELISQTASAIDRLQDDEPDRPSFVETIFHPVPSVASRAGRKSPSRITAWNAARTSLFFSWACLGFLSRSVHCNLGRPELWTMLPTD